jgi:plasmid stability protein
MATSLDQTDFIKTALRLPRELHARVQASAEGHGASLNTEIIQLLQKALESQTVEIGEKSLDAIETRVRDALKQK